jgi:integrase
MNTLRFEVSALNGAPRVTAVETPKAEQLYRNGPTVPARERNPAKEITVGSVTVQIFGRAPGPFTIAWRECAGGPRKRAMRSSFPAAKIFAEQNYPKGAITKACQDVFDEMLQRMEKDRRGERWIDDLRSRIGRFAKDYTGPVHELRAPFINEWLASLDVGPRSRNNYRVALQALVAYAKSRNYLPRSWDEMAHVDIAAQEPGEIEIWTPEQCYAFLVRCRPNLVPFVALQFFAGIRHAELDRLDWSHINLDTGNIYIPSHIAKRKTPKRNIPIQPNLAAWLQPHAKRSGPICSLGNITNALRHTADRAKMKWMRNGPRRAFISYRLALTHDIGRVAEEAGNSPTIIKKNYQRPIPEADGKKYFELWPRDESIIQLNFAGF